MQNKSILMSIKPQYVCEILNRKKTIEIRKRFPKDYVGWIYVYCTKGNGCLDYDIEWKTKKWFWWTEKDYKNILPNVNKFFNGKVVAKFWCDKVEEIRCSWGSNFIDWSKYPADERYDYYIGNEMDTCDICRVACLKMEELDNYLKGKKGYAIHISKLEVFDKPKELKEFYKVGAWKVFEEQFDSSYLKKEQQEIMEELEQTITKAPQSFQFIEGEND